MRPDAYIQEFKYGNLIELEDGKILNPVTGEVKDGKYVFVTDTTNIETDAERERKKKFAEQKARREEMERYSHKNPNKFVFTLVTDNGFETLKPESLARLIYLASFVKWGSNILMATNKTPMRKAMLPNVLGLSRKSVDRLLAELKDFIAINADGTVLLKGNYFIRGQLSFEGHFYTKVWAHIRKLYQNTQTSHHRQLGYIFQLLPYLNIEHNILCHNPYETDIDRVEPMTISEFCDAIGFDPTHWKELWRKYSKICFELDGKRERFCARIITGDDETASKIIVNPSVIYAGTQLESVKNLCKFCE